MNNKNSYVIVLNVLTWLITLEIHHRTVLILNRTIWKMRTVLTSSQTSLRWVTINEIKIGDRKKWFQVPFMQEKRNNNKINYKNKEKNLENRVSIRVGRYWCERYERKVVAKWSSEHEKKIPALELKNKIKLSFQKFEKIGILNSFNFLVSKVTFLISTLISFLAYNFHIFFIERIKVVEGGRWRNQAYSISLEKTINFVYFYTELFLGDVYGMNFIRAFYNTLPPHRDPQNKNHFMVKHRDDILEDPMS